MSSCQECFFLTKRPEDIKGLMNQIFDKVNEKGLIILTFFHFDIDKKFENLPR